MAFDLATAKKVGASTPFDISTATMVQSPNGTNNDTSNNSGLTGSNTGSGLAGARDPQGDLSLNAGQQGSAGQSLTSIAETGGALIGAAVTEPIAGIAGIAQSLNPFAEPGAGARAVESVRSAGQEFFAPQTAQGQSNIGSIAEVIEPVAQALSSAEDFLGDSTFEATGSPTLAALAKSMPTAAIELLGLASFKGVVKTGKAVAAERVANGIADSAPSIDGLKDLSRSIYKEIDDLNVKVRPESYKRMVQTTRAELKKLGLDKTITPKAERALTRLEESIGQELSVGELDTLRQVAKGAADSIESKESMLGVALINNIDDFMDSKAMLQAPKGVDVGARYAAARDMWGRAKRSETIQEAFRKANLQATGFENGIRVQFRQILTNKKKLKGFKPQEISAMEKVVKGGKGENLARLLGRFAFTEGGAHNVLTAGAGASAGALVAGPAGAVAVPIIGQVSRSLAARLTAKNAQFADDIIRSGKNAEQITKAYIKNTPRSRQSAAELAELFVTPDIDLAKISGSQLSKDAASIAKRNRELAATTAAGVSASVTKELDDSEL